MLPSPDAKLIATGGGNGLNISDASSGELLKTFKGGFTCLACQPAATGSCSH